MTIKTTGKVRKVTRGWPPERRKAQAARIRRQKPWLKSTGPRTRAGKARVARNAYKHGFRSRDYRTLCALLRWQAQFVKRVKQDIKSGANLLYSQTRSSGMNNRNTRRPDPYCAGHPVTTEGHYETHLYRRNRNRYRL